MQSFSEAAVESFGSSSSTGSRPPRAPREGVHGSRGEGGSCHSSSNPLDAKEDQEVQSPLKAPQEAPERVQNTERGRAGRKLDMDGADNARIPDRKWKSKRSGPELQTPDLNVPVGSNAIVPIGLVNSRVS